jgi:hypothetical protein
LSFCVTCTRTSGVGQHEQKYGCGWDTDGDVKGAENALEANQRAGVIIHNEIQCEGMTFGAKLKEKLDATNRRK